VVPREDLAKLALGCRILAAQGLGDLNLGHLSLRDPDGRGFWMKRAGPGLDEVRVADLVQVGFDGALLRGDGPLHIEWPIHAMVLEARADLRAVGHTHGKWTAIVSASRGVDIRPLTHAGAMFPGGFPRFEATGNLISTPDLGRSLATALAGAPAVLMRNHGATFGAASIERAVVTGVQLERAAEAEMRLRAAGAEAVASPPEEAQAKAATIYPESAVVSMFDWCARQLAKR